MGRQWLLAKREINAKRKSSGTSKLVKEIALFGGDISRFVSPAIRTEVLARVEELGRMGEY